MDRWKLTALAGWFVAAIYFVAAVRLVRELRIAQETGGPLIADAPTGPSPSEWAIHLADEGAQLVEHGYEDQATYLHAAAGQLLEVADRAPTQP